MRELRKHVVTFRLTESEYQGLKSVCGTEQDSISTTVRRAVMERAKTLKKRPKKVDDRLDEISRKLATLVGILNKGPNG